MFHLCCRIALCMYVTYFLQFQSAFKCSRIADTTSKLPALACVGKRAAEVCNTVIELENLAHLVWNCL